MTRPCFAVRLLVFLLLISIRTGPALAQDDPHLELGEGRPQAASHAPSEGNPGIGVGPLVKETLRLETVGVGIDVRPGVAEVDRRADVGSGRKRIAVDLHPLRKPASITRFARSGAMLASTLSIMP